MPTPRAILNSFLV